jgi:hypothetical protein
MSKGMVASGIQDDAAMLYRGYGWIGRISISSRMTSNRYLFVDFGG